MACIFFILEISVQNLDVGELNCTKEKEDKPKNEIPVRLRFRRTAIIIIVEGVNDR